MIRVPRLDKFTLTTEKIGDSSYAGILEGRDLDVIEKAGWDAQHGVRVESIPTPVPGDSFPPDVAHRVALACTWAARALVRLAARGASRAQDRCHLLMRIWHFKIGRIMPRSRTVEL